MFMKSPSPPLTYGGDALGRLPDGRAVFVPFALPGERVRVRLTESKRGHARGVLVEILEASPKRITPRCQHFTVCGGCNYQHLAYPDQLAAKEDILRDVLARVGGFDDPPLQPIVPSPVPWNYRNHVQFHLAPDGRLGYLAPDSHTVVPIQECFLPEEGLNEIWPRLDVEAIAGLERLSLRQGADDEALLVLESSDLQPPEFSVDFPLSVAHVSPAGTIVLAGEDDIPMEVLGRPFRVSAESFFQVNTPMAAAMVQHLLKNLVLSKDYSLIDVYCGVGLFSAFLAPQVGQLIAIELSESACEDFAANLDEFDHVTFYQGAAEDVLPRLDVRPEVVIVDPPRAGVERRALDAIINMQPRTIAYVSCDPATLARDAKRLAAAGYVLKQVTPFDLFPQTYHIETISLFDLSG
jgi:23S rRNA (uracil1939-C5)-methyltransferase